VVKSEFDDLRLMAYYLDSRRLGAITGFDLPLATQTFLAHNSIEVVYFCVQGAPC
jgi:hypothetical protein